MKTKLHLSILAAFALACFGFGATASATPVLISEATGALSMSDAVYRPAAASAGALGFANPDVVFSSPAKFLGPVQFAQVTLPESTAPSVPFYANGNFWSTVFGLIMAIAAIWKNAEASTAKKIAQSVVMGVETATQIPEVAAYEKQIKATIQAKAEQLGIQPLLDHLVQDLTPAAPALASVPTS